MLRKLFAVIFIILTASPITAPFSTFDLAAMDPLEAGSTSPVHAKAVEEMAAVPSLIFRAVPLQISEPSHIRPAVFFWDAGEVRQLVLRL